MRHDGGEGGDFLGGAIVGACDLGRSQLAREALPELPTELLEARDTAAKLATHAPPDLTVQNIAVRIDKDKGGNLGHRQPLLERRQSVSARLREPPALGETRQRLVERLEVGELHDRRMSAQGAEHTLRDVGREEARAADSERDRQEQHGPADRDQRVAPEDRVSGSPIPNPIRERRRRSRQGRRSTQGHGWRRARNRGQIKPSAAIGALLASDDRFRSPLPKGADPLP